VQWQPSLLVEQSLDSLVDTVGETTIEALEVIVWDAVISVETSA
jgi:hypothetical protein